MLCCLHALCSTSLSPLPKNSMWIRIRKQLQVDACAEITSNREWLSIYRSKTSDSCIIPQVSLSRGKCRPCQFCFQRQRRMTRIFVIHGRYFAESLPRFWCLNLIIHIFLILQPLVLLMFTICSALQDVVHPVIMPTFRCRSKCNLRQLCLPLRRKQKLDN